MHHGDAIEFLARKSRILPEGMGEKKQQQFFCRIWVPTNPHPEHLEISGDRSSRLFFRWFLALFIGKTSDITIVIRIIIYFMARTHFFKGYQTDLLTQHYLVMFCFFHLFCC